MGYVEKLRREGIGAILARRHKWYRSRLMINNRAVGRLVELTGNQIRIDGLTFSVDCADIDTAHKSTLWFGLHELEERALLERHLPSDLPLVELGGGLGVVSCLSNRKLAHPERHIVVEPLPSMAALLERNRDMNARRFRVINAALWYESPTAEISVTQSFVGNRLEGEPGAHVSVPSITLGQIVDDAGFDRCSLICDIEGAEAHLVDHELSLIAERVAFILVEIHPATLGEARANGIVESLVSAGFELAERNGRNWAFVRSNRN